VSEETKAYLFMLALTAGVGALVVAFGIWLLLDTARRLRGGVRGVATIVAYESVVPEYPEFMGVDFGAEGSSDSEPWYYPVLEFTDSSGVARRVRAAHPGAGPRLDVGTRVKIVYDPADWGHTHLASFRESWLAPILVTAMGVALLAVGIWVVG
jgi:hypothetical protein